MTPVECFPSPDKLHRWILFQLNGFGDISEECLYCGKQRTILADPEEDE